MRTGETGFDLVYGEPVWEYRGKHPEEQQAFDAAMTSRSDVVSAAVVAAYDFSPYETVVDIGGGHGRLLAAILESNPKLHGVLFDQPNVVAGADASTFEVVGGTFFEQVPTAAGLTLTNTIPTTGPTFIIEAH